MTIYKQLKDSMYFKAGTLWKMWSPSLLVLLSPSGITRSNDWFRQPQKQIPIDHVADFNEWFVVHDKEDYSM